MYNLFSEVQREIESFENDSITIASSEIEGSARYLKKNTGGYIFSQKKMLNLIDLYDNSKFETGPKDSQNKSRFFLNIGTFRRKVASKQIRIGLKDYIFIPDDYGSIWRTWFMQRQFKVWSRESLQAELINELEETFPKYGSIVTKKVGKKIERIPLRSIKNTQDAKSLKEAAMGGGFVIQEHNLSKAQAKKFPDWKLDGVKFENNKKETFYERYALVPQSCIDQYEDPNYKSTDSDEDKEMVLAVAVLTCYKEKGTSKLNGSLCYLQAINEKDFPYEEEHWDRQDGRWLGIGEMERQLENQVARNASANLRFRAMNWSSKKVFQSTDESVQRNLVKEVDDGEVLYVGPNGELKQVAMGTQALADFNAADQMLEQNSNQISFTFEAATGESMPSGTPFRLGAMLSDSVSSHFQQMKEKFALFLIRSYYNQVIPIFRKETKEHTISILGSEEGAQHFLQALKEHYVWEEFKDMLLKGNVPVLADIEAKADEYLKKQLYHFVDIMKGYYDEAKFHMELDITGQAIDTKAEIETMTNIFMVVSKNPMALQDPNMMRLLELIVSKTGKTMKDWLGSIKQQGPPPMPGQVPGQPGQPQLNAANNPQQTGRPAVSTPIQ